MEGNDIVMFQGGYNVVVLEPTLVYLDAPLPRRTRALSHGTARQREAALRQTIACYRLNELMGRWIQYQGHANSIPTAVWGFGDRELFDALVERIGRLFGRYIFRTEHFATERDALAALTADSSIGTVYDADAERVDGLWHLRGHRVLRGGAP